MNFLSPFSLRLWLIAFLCAAIPLPVLMPVRTETPYTIWAVSFGVIFIAHLFSASTLYAISSAPGNRTAFSILPGLVVWYGLLMGLVIFFALPYSRPYLIIGISTSIITSYLDFLKSIRQQIRLAYIPVGEAVSLASIPDIDWVKMDKINHLPPEIDGIVADLHARELSGEWQRFLAQCVLLDIPVLNLHQVEESLTGRIKIHHMYENNFGSLMPSKPYIHFKQFVDSLASLLMLPLVLPVLALAAIAIKLDDGGSIFYSQQRVGYRGRLFNIYKLRTMKENAPTDTTASGDSRITRIGHFLRKTRIDELPQLLNVLKCEMSLIGPRAEYKKFADELERHLPFYQYRHIVKPGITGWAQVMQGYATGPEETRIKLEHDFYYIKNFSLSLDVLIAFKTVRTIFTGSGAR
jgi:lipopolysaccharide/colanic/teichoic acid biosynthesis glycosyltransferase